MRSVQPTVNREKRRAYAKGQRNIKPIVNTDEPRVQYVADAEQWRGMEVNRRMGILNDLGFDTSEPITLSYYCKSADDNDVESMYEAPDPRDADVWVYEQGWIAKENH